MAGVRIGIVGGGPRALWAVEELVARADKLPTDVAIDLWEPEPQVGAGRVYRAEQSELWRMNLRADRIETALGSYGAWREEQVRRGVQLDGGFFPPRREVGQFLAASWSAVVARAPQGMRIAHRRAWVTDVDRAPSEGHKQRGEGTGHWVVGFSADGAGVSVPGERPTGREHYDELLIATGHALQWPGELRDSRLYAKLSDIPAGARVGVRGSALTFLDAALELTLGRGGHVTDVSAYPRYVPSGREPVLIPVNRSGRFMQVKPQPGGRWDTPALRKKISRALEPARAAVENAADLAELQYAVTGAALRILQVIHPEGHGAGATSTSAEASVWEVLHGTDTPTDPVAELRESVEVAAGHRAPRAAWAVGEAWRGLYPQIVARASFDGRDSLPGFAYLAYTLERVAFGPPLETAVPLLAALDAGVIRAEGLGSPELLDSGVLHGQPLDGLWDATIASPGVQPGSLCAQLVDRGIARLRCSPDHPEAGSGCGVDVEKNGAVPGHETLAVVGRDAEGTVLGLDTLSRTMHPTLVAWADGVAARWPRGAM